MRIIYEEHINKWLEKYQVSTEKLLSILLCTETLRLHDARETNTLKGHDSIGLSIAQLNTMIVLCDPDNYKIVPNEVVRAIHEHINNMQLLDRLASGDQISMATLFCSIHTEACSTDESKTYEVFKWLISSAMDNLSCELVQSTQPGHTGAYELTFPDKSTVRFHFIDKDVSPVYSCTVGAKARTFTCFSQVVPGITVDGAIDTVYWEKPVSSENSIDRPKGIGGDPFFDMTTALDCLQTAYKTNKKITAINAACNVYSCLKAITKNLGITIEDLNTHLTDTKA